MKAYGILRKDVNSLEFWAGSQSSEGNKTKSKLKRASRIIYKKIGRSKFKQKLIKEINRDFV